MHRNVQRFRGGLVFKARRLLHHPTLGLRVIKKKKVEGLVGGSRRVGFRGEGSDVRVQGSGLSV